MGLYNTVFVRCPKCGEITECQSKGGSCEMQEFMLESAPLLDLAEVADDSEKGRLYCGSCRAKLRILVQKMVSVALESQW